MLFSLKSFRLNRPHSEFTPAISAFCIEKNALSLKNDEIKIIIGNVKHLDVSSEIIN